MSWNDLKKGRVKTKGVLEWVEIGGRSVKGHVQGNSQVPPGFPTSAVQ